MESATAMIFSSSPNSAIHLAAVLGPTPGTPGRLSLLSPTRAASDRYCFGVTPYFSNTASGVMLTKSDIPFRG